MIDYPNKLNIIFEKLDKFHIKPIIIGGYIRDSLLKIPSSDIDIELYGVDSLLEVETILEEFGKVTSVGKSFGVCKLFFENLELDFSLPRKDSKISSGHKGIKVDTDKNLNFTAASKRRDFTINAIGYDVKNKKLLDPFHGQEDLKQKILRAVDLKKFDEDPLRVLRALVFASRFHFTLEKQLFSLCKDMIHRKLLEELPKERIFNEMKKLLLKSKKPSYGFSLLKEIDGFFYFSEFKSISEQEYHKILISIDRYAVLSTHLNEYNRLISFLALITYPFSQCERESFLKHLTQQSSLLKDITLFVKLTHTLKLQKLDDYALYLLATQVKIRDFIPFLQAYLNEEDLVLIEKMKKRARELGVFESKLPALLEGKDLIKKGLKPSKKFKILLDEAYQAQLKYKFLTKQEILHHLKEKKLLD